MAARIPLTCSSKRGGESSSRTRRANFGASTRGALRGLENNSRKDDAGTGGGARLENVVCNLCGSGRHTPVYEMPDRRFFREEFFTVVECDQCGLGFVNPRPAAAEMQKYYPREYYQNPATTSHHRYLQRRFTAQAAYLEELEHDGGRKKLLDVGCANGEFPRFMAARGWHVEGVEGSESSQRLSDFRGYTPE